MNVIEIYSQQYAWRAWSAVLDALPDVNGHAVLDLGCGLATSQTTLQLAVPE